jgi:hypothetical protein
VKCVLPEEMPYRKLVRDESELRIHLLSEIWMLIAWEKSSLMLLLMVEVGNAVLIKEATCIREEDHGIAGVISLLKVRFLLVMCCSHRNFTDHITRNSFMSISTCPSDMRKKSTVRDNPYSHATADHDGPENIVENAWRTREVPIEAKSMGMRCIRLLYTFRIERCTLVHFRRETCGSSGRVDFLSEIHRLIIPSLSQTRSTLINSLLLEN